MLDTLLDHLSNVKFSHKKNSDGLCVIVKIFFFNKRLIIPNPNVFEVHLFNIFYFTLQRSQYSYINKGRQNVSTCFLTDQYDSQCVTGKNMWEQTRWFHVRLDCVRVT